MCSDGTFLTPLPQTTGEEAIFNGADVYWQQAVPDNGITGGQNNNYGAWDTFTFSFAYMYMYMHTLLNLFLHCLQLPHSYRDQQSDMPIMCPVA